MMVCLSLCLERALRRGHDIRHAGVGLNSHAQCTPEGLEKRLGNVMSIMAAYRVEMERHSGMVDQTLKEFVKQIDIELTDMRAAKINRHFQTRTTRKIDHYPAQSFIQGHIGMPIPANTFLVADSVGECLTERNPDILDGVVRVNVQISVGVDIQIDHPMPSDLVKHVLEKRYSGDQMTLAGSIKIDGCAHLGLQGVTLNGSDTRLHGVDAIAYLAFRK